MIKKQTVKSFILGIFTLLGMSTALLTPAFAADCGGVQTSIISCGGAQSGGTCTGGATLTDGECVGGAAVAEKSDPKTGDCPDGSTVTLDDSGDFPACPDFAPTETDLTSTGLWGVLLMAINILTAGIGVAAVGGIVYGAVLYTSAGGAADQVKKARGIITNVVIGLVAYALMFSLLNFLIPGGLFN
jgi:hypothetical protein